MDQISLVDQHDEYCIGAELRWLLIASDEGKVDAAATEASGILIVSFNIFLHKTDVTRRKVARVKYRVLIPTE